MAAAALKNFTVEDVITALRNVLNQPAGLHEPTFSGNEWKYVKECLDTGWVSSVGSYVDRFEKDLCAFTGVRYAIATNNGTAALHTILLLSGVKQDDEVIIPSLTFIATANAVTYCGAIPHFADTEEATLSIDPEKLSRYLQENAVLKNGACFNAKTGRPIKALIAMHTFGHPADLNALQGICDRFCLTLIEDAAESIGSYYNGRHTGHWGQMAALSFNGNKVITTGGGGAVLTNDENIAVAARHLTDTGKVPHPWLREHDVVGFNYRLTNLNAAVGCAQLEQLPLFLQKKRALADAYNAAFSGLHGIKFFQEPQHCQSNYWLNVLMLDSDHIAYRDDILKAANNAGFRAQPTWTPVHRLTMYQGCPRMDLSHTNGLFEKIINIPSSPHLADKITT